MIRLQYFAGRIRMLEGWRRVLIAVLCGMLAALALPPLGFWPALLIAFPVLVLLLDGAARRPRSGFSAGWSFGIGYFIAAFHWIGFAFLVEAETYLWMMPFAVGGLAAAMAVYWGLAGMIAARLWPNGVARLFLLAALIALAELARGHLLTGFPWAAPGLIAMASESLAQSASVIGMTGLTFLIVLWASLPVLLGDRHLSRRSALAPAALALLLAAMAGAGAVRLRGEAAFDESVKLRIVQPNISQDMKWRSDNARDIFEKLLALSFQEPAGATHIVWPESSVPFLIEKSEEALERIRDALPEGAALVMGALREDAEANVYNSILAFDSEGNLAARYDKWRLVPGGEFLPFAWILEPLGFRKVAKTPGSFAAGPGPMTIPLPGAPAAGFLVCYEAIFPDRLVDPADRPGWLINVTNDGWFGRSTGPYQHLAQARMRAIEQGLPLVRAANTGISAVVDPYGRTVADLRLDAEGVIDQRLPAAIAPTVYARFGDSLVVLMIAAGAALGLLRNFRRHGLS
jgi:apolipoprotein N-acyltransferase